MLLVLGQAGESRGTFKQSNPLSDIKMHWPHEYFHSLSEGLIMCFVRDVDVE